MVGFGLVVAPAISVARYYSAVPGWILCPLAEPPHERLLLRGAGGALVQDRQPAAVETGSLEFVHQTRHAICAQLGSRNEGDDIGDPYLLESRDVRPQIAVVVLAPGSESDTEPAPSSRQASKTKRAPLVPRRQWGP